MGQASPLDGTIPNNAMRQSRSEASASRFDSLMLELLHLAGLQSEGSTYSEANIEEALCRIRDKISHSNQVGQGERFKSQYRRKILIVGLLGIINYQLKNILKQAHCETTIVKSSEDAVAAFQKDDYDGVIIDLFMPTEREGFTTLNEIKKIATLSNLSFHIMVIANNVAQTSQLQSEADVRGANLFLTRQDGWHQQLVNYIQEITGSQVS